jgi:hypothetical protein
MMKYLFACLVVLPSACLDVESAAEDTGNATDNLDGPIFPDEEFPPGDSCAVPVPLTCPFSIGYSLSARASFVNDLRVDRSVSQSLVAAITPDGSTIQCQPGQPFVISDVPTLGVFLPSGVTATPNGDNTELIFSAEVDGTRMSPAFPNKAFCSLTCDKDSPDTAARCPRGIDIAIDDATVQIDGQRARLIDLDGTIQSTRLVPGTGRTDTVCRLTLPPSRVATQISRRPNDVIAVSGRRFVRGYELTGQALRDACAAISSATCEGDGACTANATERCVSDFRRPDPCIRTDVPSPR